MSKKRVLLRATPEILKECVEKRNARVFYETNSALLFRYAIEKRNKNRK
jgi:hypothetical protein